MICHVVDNWNVFSNGVSFGCWLTANVIFTSGAHWCFAIWLATNALTRIA